MRIGVEFRTQEGLGFEPAFGITGQNSTHGHGEQARGVPHGDLGSEFDSALPTPVPVCDRRGLPSGARVFGHLRKIGQTLSLEVRPLSSLSDGCVVAEPVRKWRHPAVGG